MGLTASLQSSSDPFTPQIVLKAAQNSTGKTKAGKSQQLLATIVDPKVNEIRGTVVSGTIAQNMAQNKMASYFALNHAYVIFKFSCQSQVRCEVSSYESGTAVFISKIIWFNADLELAFECATEGLTIMEIVNYAKLYQQSGDYHVVQRNCYDFVASMVEDFPGAQEVIKQWKQSQVNKVPSLFRR